MTVRVVTLSLLFALAVSQSAQAAQPGGDLPPRALTPTTVSDADYPMLALVTAAQGRTLLNVSVGPDGRVAGATVATSSGSPSLDERAIQIARTRWNFQPGTRNGQPVAATVPVEVNWVLPLQPATQPHLDAPPLPAGATPPRVTERLMGQPGDYPSIAMEIKEQGVVGVRYQVRADGSVGDVQIVQSSGSARLDNASIRLVRERWRSDPARLAGMPVDSWQTMTIAFSLLPSNVYGARPTCYAQPILGRESALVGGELEFRWISELDLERLMRWRTRFVEDFVPLWTQVSNTGAVTGALIGTSNGWMQLNDAWRQALTRDRTYPATQGSCWYYEALAILG
jgi:TonB family protein